MAFVRRSRGMGAANCPSLAQLMGVTDSSDPCQQTSQVPTETTYPVTMTTGAGDNPQLAPPGAPASASLGLMSWLQTNPAAMLGLGAALLVVVGGALLGGHRR
jgi:hypothetical protein